MACREGAEKEWSSADGGLILAASTGCGSSSSRKFAMPLLDHFHPPLHGPRRWEGFHHSWATSIAQQLNLEALPPGYFAEPEISLGPPLEIDAATMESTGSDPSADRGHTAVWSPPQPKIVAKADFAHLDSYEVRVYQDLGGAELRAAVELVSPANKDRDG